MQAVKTEECAPLSMGSIRQEFLGQMLFKALLYLIVLHSPKLLYRATTSMSSIVVQPCAVT